MMRVADSRRNRRKLLDAESSFLLVNREAFDVVNRINRMPGILNEAGWNIWGYQVDGLRVFEATAPVGCGGMRSMSVHAGLRSDT